MWGNYDLREIDETGRILRLAGLDFSEEMEALLELFPLTRAEEEAEIAEADAWAARHPEFMEEMGALVEKRMAELREAGRGEFPSASLYGR